MRQFMKKEQNTKILPIFDLPGWGANFHPNDSIIFAKMLQICHYRGISTNTEQNSNLLDLYPPLLRQTKQNCVRPA